MTTHKQSSGKNFSTDQVQPTNPLPQLGISQCLLGEHVRYDGGHKRDRFLTDVLGRFVEWVPVCPETEAGLGIPREAMRLVSTNGSPHLITINSKIDHTSLITQFSRKKIRELKKNQLDGYILKRNSPSCGFHHVRVYTPQGMPSTSGVGLFADILQRSLPRLPVEDEGRLQDLSIRENFIERIFCAHRWNLLQRERLSRGHIVQFHTQHKYLLLAHSRSHYQQLGRLVASANQYTPHQLADIYGPIFAEALQVKATVRKHVNVLQHLLGHLKKLLIKVERDELQESIWDYHRAITPLTVPLTLISHYVRVFDIEYLSDQVYLNPHPKELMLRNHV